MKLLPHTSWTWRKSARSSAGIAGIASIDERKCSEVGTTCTNVEWGPELPIPQDVFFPAYTLNAKSTFSQRDSVLLNPLNDCQYQSRVCPTSIKPPESSAANEKTHGCSFCNQPGICPFEQIPCLGRVALRWRLVRGRREGHRKRYTCEVVRMLEMRWCIRSLRSV